MVKEANQPAAIKKKDFTMMLPNRTLPYRAILLRMWIEPSSYRTPNWRFSLENVETGERSGFGDLDHLIYHLLTLMEEPLMHPTQEAEEHVQAS